MSDVAGVAIGEHMVNLRVLSLAYCNRVSDVSLRAFAKNIKTLVSLDLSYCVQVTVEEVERTTIRLPRCRVMMRHIMGKQQRKKLARMAAERAALDGDDVPDEAIG